MLDPEYLERAGDIVGAVYSEIEADMCDHLVRAMLAGDVSDWKSQKALALLAQGQAPQLRMVLERYRSQVREAVRREVEEALARSDAHDLAVVKRALGIDLPKVSTQQVALAVKTICEMLERDNVDLMGGARDAFFREVAQAVTEAGSGLASIDEAMRRATRRLARNGIDCIQYRDPTTGNKTVRNHVDVAVRRHVRTQLQQACAERTMQVCELTGCGFVEVSSHYGARPSHQEWEGRVYSLKGRVTVSGVTYEDFGYGTGYYGTGPYATLGDRLCGVNCRHHWGPWFPGMPRAYHPNPKHPSGKSNAEIYELTQKQRALERALRSTKRELSAALRAYEAEPSLENQTIANQLKARLKRQNDRMKELVAENRDVLTRQPNREYAGDMPRVRVPENTKQGYVPERPHNETTASPVAKAADFDALDEVLSQRAGGGISRDVRALDFESVRATACGIDDVLTHYGITQGPLLEIGTESMDAGSLADTAPNGHVRLNSRYFTSPVASATSTGRHEGGHLLEVYLSRGDEVRFLSGRDAKRIMTRAFRTFKKSHPDTNLTTEKAIGSVSLYPTRERIRTGKASALYSEGLAECVMEIVGQELDGDSFLWHVDQSVREELRRYAG